MSGTFRRPGWETWLLLLLLVSACGSDPGSDDSLLPEALRPGSADGVRYQASLDGIDAEGDVAALIRQSARTFTLLDRPPPSLARLARRAEGDIPVIEKVLRSEGYYLGRAETALTPPPETDSAAEARVTFTLAPGPRFAIGSFSVRQPDGALLVARGDAEFEPLPMDQTTGGDGLTPTEPPLTLLPEPGAPARGADIVAAEERVVDWYREHGHPYAATHGRTARADVKAATLTVETRIDPGPPVRYGPVQVQGTDRLEADYIHGFVPWEPGAAVAQSALDALQQELGATGLFESVRVTLPDPAPAHAEADANAEADAAAVPVTIAVEEDKPRSIGGGARFSTADGPGARLFWEHRNLFGRAERLRTTADVGTIEQSLEARFALPRFMIPDRSLTADVTVTRADDEVAKETSAETAVGVQEILSQHWRAGGSVALEAAELTDNDGTRRSYLVRLPAFAQYDTTEDLFDPTSGMRMRLSTAPAAGRFDQQPTSFLTVEGSASRYHALTASGDVTLAGRSRIGSILGQNRDGVPINRRLFSGGGGSVRGYGTDFIGPLDDEGDPVGGLSVIEAGIELRVRITESIGVVPFLEAGSVSEAIVPDFADGVQVGAGLGFRYYSPAGPARLDLAVPLNPRDEDDAFQFYVSIGQAY